MLFLIYVNDIHTVSNKLNFILYADDSHDTTLTSPLCSFTHGAQNDVSHVSSQINSELHEPRIFYSSGHWPETVTNAHVSAHFR